MRSSHSPHPASVLPELQQALHHVFHELDGRRYDAVVDSFAADGRWLRQGRWLAGHGAIRAALEAREVNVETCHVISNALVTALDGSTATLEAYMTAYRYPSSEDVTSIAGPLRINHVVTVFARQAEGNWLIAEQRLVPLVAFDGA